MLHQLSTPCRTPRRFAFLILRLALHLLTPSYSPPCLSSACHPSSPLDRPFPFAVKSPCTSHPSSCDLTSSLAPIAFGQHQKCKTPLLYVAPVAHHPLSIAPRGLDPVSHWKESYWILFFSGLAVAFLLSPFDLDDSLAILHIPFSL